MNAVRAASEALAMALASVHLGADLVPTTRDPGASIDPPATVQGLPALRWGRLDLGPTDATFVVYVVVPSDEYAEERLLVLVEEVSDAVDESTTGSVISATPFVFTAGTNQLPAYEIAVEVPLNG